MLQFEEYKVKLNNLVPALEELRGNLGLEQAAREVEELEMKSAQPGFWDNPEASQKIVSRMGALKGKIEGFAKMLSSHEDLLTLCELAIEAEDESMLEELQVGYAELEDSMNKAKLETLLTGTYDKNNALVSFQAGAGGTEAQDWCSMLYRMYTRWAERHGFTYKIMDYQDGDEAGLKSASILIEGENAYGYLKGENGVHRLVRIS
ncbi:MAG: PCRF domain-containing protein, partial [Butyricicoccus sp.]|nr:PCRF domain-containing protein [Butyricicoccus sp.]